MCWPCELFTSCIYKLALDSETQQRVRVVITPAHILDIQPICKMATQIPVAGSQEKWIKVSGLCVNLWERIKASTFEKWKHRVPESPVAIVRQQWHESIFICFIVLSSRIAFEACGNSLDWLTDSANHKTSNILDPQWASSSTLPLCLVYWIIKASYMVENMPPTFVVCTFAPIHNYLSHTQVL